MLRGIDVQLEAEERYTRIPNTRLTQVNSVHSTFGFDVAWLMSPLILGNKPASILFVGQALFRSLARPSKRRTVALLIAAELLVASVAFAGGPRLRLQRERTNQDESVRVKAFVLSPVPLGAYTLDLSFDPALLELVDISGGSAEFGSAPIKNPEQFAGGVVRFSAFQPVRMDGPRGRCHVATFTFRPRVQDGRTRIELSAVTVADTAGSKYEAPKRKKRLRIRGGKVR